MNDARLPPVVPPGLLDAAFEAWRNQDYAAAAALFRRAWQHRPHEPTLAYYLGVCAVRRGAWQGAELWLARAAQLATAHGDVALVHDVTMRRFELGLARGRALRERLVETPAPCTDCGGEVRVVEECLAPAADWLRRRWACAVCGARGSDERGVPHRGLHPDRGAAEVVSPGRDRPGSTH